jgi:SET domain
MFRLAMVPGKGRGLLACEAIRPGTCLERAPAVRLRATDRERIHRTGLFPYTFVEADGSADGAQGCILAFGHLTFCNHSESPNAVIRWSSDSVGLWGHLEAMRFIAAGEEITLFYTNITEYSARDLFI